MIKKFAVIMVLAAVSFSQAQWMDSAGNAVVDISPQFRYYPTDMAADTLDQYGNAISAGSVTFVSTGPNGTVDSTDNLNAAGDDGRLISALISVADDTIAVESVLPQFDDGIAWGAATGFNGKIQLSGNAIAASFLPVTETETVLFRLPAEMTLEDFTNADGLITIETGQNDTFGAPGRTLFADIDPADAVGDGALFSIVQIPEPSSFALIATALLAGLGLRRRS